MKKKILIAVDGSTHARNGLLYAADLLSKSSDFHCGLIHIQPMISQYLFDEAGIDPKVGKALQRVLEYNRAQSEEILEKSKQLLLSHGISGSAVETISHPRTLGLAKDIIEHAHKHLYDAIVTGRRGLSRVQKIFMGSISTKLAEFSSGNPVWIIDGEIRPRRFLVAVDVAAPWLHLLDHLSLICEGMEEIHLTFIHVLPNQSLDGIDPLFPGMDEVGAMIAHNERQMVERFWAEATHTLAAAGLQRHQMEMLTPTKTGRIGRMILDETEGQAYDTVVIGRRGSGQAFYFGSVSRYVAERLTGHALWVLG